MTPDVLFPKKSPKVRVCRFFNSLKYDTSPVPMTSVVTTSNERVLYSSNEFAVDGDNDINLLILFFEVEVSFVVCTIYSNLPVVVIVSLMIKL